MGRRSRSFRAPIINSIKNIVRDTTAVPTGANTDVLIAKAVDSPDPGTNIADCSQGSKIFRIWCDITIYTSAESAVGVTNACDFYIIKNPGDNLTEPAPGSTGTSNEKKFIFYTSAGLTGPRTQGSELLKMRRWIKVPKIYQRMGIDDTFRLILRPIGVAHICCSNFIYKYYK